MRKREPRSLPWTRRLSWLAASVPHKLASNTSQNAVNLIAMPGSLFYFLG